MYVSESPAHTHCIRLSRSATSRPLYLPDRTLAMHLCADRGLRPRHLSSAGRIWLRHLYCSRIYTLRAVLWLLTLVWPLSLWVPILPAIKQSIHLFVMAQPPVQRLAAPCVTPRSFISCETSKLPSTRSGKRLFPRWAATSLSLLCAVLVAACSCLHYNLWLRRWMFLQSFSALENLSCWLWFKGARIILRRAWSTRSVSLH